MPDTSAAQVMTTNEAMRLIRSDEALDQAVALVAELDFSMLRRKLVEEKGWTMETCDDVEDLYRKFLALNVRYPEKKVCPSGPIDDFWHAHILDTRAYAADCDRLFGRMLHHFPYFGMRGPKDKVDLESTFAESIDLFILHYGVDPTGGDAEARSCSPQRCP